MPLSLTTKPARIVPGRNVELSFSGADSATNFIRLWVTAAPAGSSQRAELDAARRTASDTGRSLFFEGDSSKPLRHTFEVGGVYTLQAQEYTKGATSYGGGYGGSPDSFPSETKVGSETTLTIYVGTRLSCPLGARKLGTARLILYVWGDTVRATTAGEHGEFTPAIVEPTTERAKNAAAASTVQAKLDALADETWSALLDVDDLIADMVDKIDSHFGDGVHSAADSDNTAAIGALPTSAASYGNAEAVHRAARDILEALSRHMGNRDDDGAVSGYHSAADLQNLPLADPPPGASDPALSYAALASIFVGYEAHRVDTTAHSSADTTNDLTAGNLSPLLDLMGEFLRLLRGDTAALPSGEHEGVVGLARGGFRKA